MFGFIVSKIEIGIVGFAIFRQEKHLDENSAKKVLFTESFFVECSVSLRFFVEFFF